MNSNFFCIIYNEARGLWVVVRESASSKGAPRFSGCMSMLLGQLLALSMLHPLPLQAQVVAAPSAPVANRPQIDVTVNGRPLVQITTPSAAGVSNNHYLQFNVDSQGVILNNARTLALTQQGGYVAGNPYLAGGSARVILNQVTGTSPSLIQGYIEVAGQRADVVLANPNGITCNGGGFINTSRGVLTTGLPVLGAGGSLESFRVTQGQIQIDAAGLNNSGLDQLDLIARSVQVNGELWAGGNLNVIAGANQVSYADLGVQVIQGDGTQPTVGIDVAQLGGMYAGRIHLIGTEAGVGVNSQGTLAAQSGDFLLSSEGHITLSGLTAAQGRAVVAATEGIAHSGALYAQQTASLASLGELRNTGSLAAGGDLTLVAATLTSTGTLGAGIDGEGLATRTGDLALLASDAVTLTGGAVAHDRLWVDAGGTLTNGGELEADALSLNGRDVNQAVQKPPRHSSGDTKCDLDAATIILHHASY